MTPKELPDGISFTYVAAVFSDRTAARAPCPTPHIGRATMGQSRSQMPAPFSCALWRLRVILGLLANDTDVTAAPTV